MGDAADLQHFLSAPEWLNDTIQVLQNLALKSDVFLHHYTQLVAHRK
jgi:hypothetical protein